MRQICAPQKICGASIQVQFVSNPSPGLSFRGGRFSLEESRGTKSESLFHTLCYYNQMYKVYAGKDGIFLYATKTKVDLNQNFRRSLLRSYNDKATIKNGKKILRGAKRTASCCPGSAFATIATPWLRACSLAAH